MREHLLGRTPRLTAYFVGIAAGLALLVAGLEATRVLLVGELSSTTALAYGGLGVLGGLALSFVAGYLNGSLLASWAGGAVPAAGLVGPPLVDGSLRAVGVAALGAVGAGVLLGTLGFVVAVEKHRHDARSADLPAPASRPELLALAAGAVALGALLSTAALYL